MTQFDIFSINSKISMCEMKLKELDQLKQKITKNSKQLEVRSLQRVNKVALFEVKIKHTSEYLVKLGPDYFAKTKTQNVLDIVSARIAKVEGDIKKWRELKESIQQKKKKQKSGINDFDSLRNGLECSIDPVGENAEGQKIFNIVEFGEPQGLKRKANALKNNDVLEQQVPDRIKKQQNISVIQQEKKITQTTVQQFQKPTKKMSKFKMERMKMKEQK